MRDNNNKNNNNSKNSNNNLIWGPNQLLLQTEVTAFAIGFENICEAAILTLALDKATVAMPGTLTGSSLVLMTRRFKKDVLKPVFGVSHREHPRKYQ